MREKGIGVFARRFQKVNDSRIPSLVVRLFHLVNDIRIRGLGPSLDAEGTSTLG